MLSTINKNNTVIGHCKNKHHVTFVSRFGTISNMSLQVCNCCGWSKVTTYQGLRTHQGKMGCTQKGMRIPESEQFRRSYLPKYTYLGPSIKVEEPFTNIFTPSIKSGEQHTADCVHTQSIITKATVCITGASNSPAAYV